MQHSIVSDLTVGLLAAGVSFWSIVDHVPHEDIPEAHNGKARFEADPNSRFGIEWGAPHSEALATILSYVSDRDLGVLASLCETEDTFEGGLILDHIDTEMARRETRIRGASDWDMSEAETEPGLSDWDMSYDEPGDDAAYWDMDDDEIDPFWDSPEARERAQIEAWDDEVAF